jgi:Tfp pilus assembly protein PilX
VARDLRPVFARRHGNPVTGGQQQRPDLRLDSRFYIVDLGLAADAAGEVYQIDAFSSGATAGTVAVVESTYEVQQGVVNRGGL